MDKSTISMAIFNSYVSLPEGIYPLSIIFHCIHWIPFVVDLYLHLCLIYIHYIHDVSMMCPSLVPPGLPLWTLKTRMPPKLLWTPYICTSSSCHPRASLLYYKPFLYRIYVYIYIYTWYYVYWLYIYIHLYILIYIYMYRWDLLYSLKLGPPNDSSWSSHAWWLVPNVQGEPQEMAWNVGTCLVPQVAAHGMHICRFVVIFFVCVWWLLLASPSEWTHTHKVKYMQEHII